MAYSGTFIGDLDTALPDGSVETQAALDDAQRELRSVARNTVAIEHSLAGVHAFPTGADAARPAGVTGQWYFNTEYHAWERYNGSAWIKMKVWQPQSISMFGGPLAPENLSSSSYQPRLRLNFVSETGSFQPLIYTPVYLLKGTFDFRGSITYSQNSFGQSSAGFTVKVTIVGIGDITISAGTSNDSGRVGLTADSAAAASLTIPSDGWYILNLQASGTTQIRGITILSASVHWELA